MTEPGRSTWLQRLARNRSVVAGLALLLAVVLAAAFAGVVATHNPARLDPPRRLLPPSVEHSPGPGVGNVICALSVVYTPRTAMLIRSTVLGIRDLDYVHAARALGRRDLAIAARHILPNCVGPLLVQGSFIFAYAILAEAILGFL